VGRVGKRLKRCLAEPVESLFAQVPRALLASALSAAVDFGVLCFLVEFAAFHPVPAAVIGYFAGGVLQYVLCSLWVFPGSPQNAATGFLAFTILSLVGVGITWLTMAGLYDVAHIHYSFAKVGALGLAFSWNFLSRKFLLFHPESRGA
jgi:putative flippase GtrA